VYVRQNIMESFLKEVLIEYINFIEDYKSLISKQNKNESDFINMNNGKIGQYDFHYHGAGCRLEKEGVVCEFDFLPENEFPIKFSSWEIYEFINTNSKWNGLKYRLEDVHTGLLNLVIMKKLVLLEVGGRKFPIFQVKDLWVFQD